MLSIPCPHALPCFYSSSRGRIRRDGWLFQNSLARRTATPSAHPAWLMPWLTCLLSPSLSPRACPYVASGCWTSKALRQSRRPAGSTVSMYVPVVGKSKLLTYTWLAAAFYFTPSGCGGGPDLCKERFVLLLSSWSLCRSNGFTAGLNGIILTTILKCLSG